MNFSKIFRALLCTLLICLPMAAQADGKLNLRSTCKSRDGFKIELFTEASDSNKIVEIHVFDPEIGPDTKVYKLSEVLPDPPVDSGMMWAMAQARMMDSTKQCSPFLIPRDHEYNW